MKRRTNPLDHVSVAAPCPASWERMIGNEQVRFCAQCELNVYNLSGMTRTEAERLIAQSEGRLCIRYYRRADGTILTKNCPVGLRALKQRLSRMAGAVASMVLSFLAGILAFAGLQSAPPRQEYMQGAIARMPDSSPGEVKQTQEESVGPVTAVAGEMVIMPQMGKFAAKAQRRR